MPNEGDHEAAYPRGADPALLYHVRPSDGKLAPLILQSFQDERSLPESRKWKRMGRKSPSPTTTLGKMSYWIGAPLLEPGSAEMRFERSRAVGEVALRMAISWPLSCFLFYGFEFMTAPFQTAVQTPGVQLALPDSRYQPVRHLGGHDTGVQASRSAESSQAAGAAQRRAYTDDIDLDTDLTAEQTTTTTGEDDDAHTILVETSDQGTASRPRYLCYITDPARDEFETINVSQFLDREGDDVDMEFVFVSYTREQFRVATDDEIDAYPGYPDEATREANRQLARQDRALLVAWGVDAAKRAGKRAFWIDFECVRDRDGVARTSSKSDDVYRICDVVRAAHSMIIATGPSASEKVDAILAGQEDSTPAGQLATTKWLRHWGSRLWTLPELLLCPSEHRIKLYVLGSSQETNEPVALAKRNFAERAWDDAELVKELVNHYEGSAILSQMQLMETALACFARRGTHQFSPGDIAYALMGLLPTSQRPAVHAGDSGFQAFARLSLANDGGEFLSRMVCLLPPTQGRDDAAWYDDGKDVWSARIRDVHPSSRVVRVATPDTLVLDGAHAAAIRWDGFDADAARQGEMPTSQVLLALLVWSAGFGLGAIGVLCLASHLNVPGESVWRGRPWLGVVFVVVILGTPAFLAPLLYLRYQRKNSRRHMKAQIVGLEGHVAAGTIEHHLWGHDGGLLTLVDVTTTTESGYRDETDTDAAAAPRRPQREMHKFSLVDTHMMTVTHIATHNPPVAVFAMGSAAGEQRMLLCSYDWRDDTFERETVLRAESKMVDQMRRIDQFRLRLRSRNDDGRDDEVPVVARDAVGRWKQETLYVFLVLITLNMLLPLYGHPRAEYTLPVDEHRKMAYSVAFTLAQIPTYLFATRMSLERVLPQFVLIKSFLPGLLALISATPTGTMIRFIVAGLVEGITYPLLMVLLWLWWSSSPARLAAHALALQALSLVLPLVGYRLLSGTPQFKLPIMYFFGVLGMMLQVGMVTVGRRRMGAPAEAQWLPASLRLKVTQQQQRPTATTGRPSVKKYIVPGVLFAVSVLGHLAADGPMAMTSTAPLLWLLWVYGALVVVFAIGVLRSEKSTALLLILVIALSSVGSIWKNSANETMPMLSGILANVRIFILPMIWVLANSLLETWPEKLQTLCLSLAGLALDSALKTMGRAVYIWPVQASAGIAAIMLVVALGIYDANRQGRIAL